MNCHEARAGLWPPEQPRLAGPEVVAARSHVEGCPGCTEFFAQDRGLLDVYARVSEVRAPIEVRERVFGAVARARAGASASEGHGAPRPELGYAWPLLAVASLALAFAAWPYGAAIEAGSPPAEGAVFVEDYLRRAVGQDHIRTAEADEVRRFLERELGMPVSPLVLAGLEIEGAEICLLEGKRGAMIVYKKGGASVSHYLVPREGAAGREPTVLDEGGVHGREMPVVTWSTPAIEHALVGELGAVELLEIARAASRSDGRAPRPSLSRPPVSGRSPPPAPR